MIKIPIAQDYYLWMDPDNMGRANCFRGRRLLVLSNSYAVQIPRSQHLFNNPVLDFYCPANFLVDESNLYPIRSILMQRYQVTETIPAQQCQYDYILDKCNNILSGQIAVFPAGLNEASRAIYNEFAKDIDVLTVRNRFLGGRTTLSNVINTLHEKSYPYSKILCGFGRRGDGINIYHPRIRQLEFPPSYDAGRPPPYYDYDRPPPYQP